MDAPQLPAQIAEAVGLSPDLVDPCIEQAVGARQLAWLGSAGRYLVRPALLQKTLAGIERALMDFHSKNPQATGIAKEALRQRVNERLPKDCFDALLEEAQAKGQIVQKAQLTGKMTDDTCKIAYTELEKQFADYYVKMSIFAKTLLKNQFKAVAKEKATQDIELI